MFDLYDRLVAATNGAVDPLVGRQLELLGYDPAYSLTPAPDSDRPLAAPGRTIALRSCAIRGPSGSSAWATTSLSAP